MAGESTPLKDQLKENLSDPKDAGANVFEVALSEASTQGTQTSTSPEDNNSSRIILSQQLISEYSDDILEHLFNQEQKVDISDNLRRHGISKELRAKMIDWMIEVLSKTECSPDTLFVAVRCMDRFFKQVGCECTSGDLHVVGVSSMVLAAKYEEVIPLRLKFVEEKITHGKIKADQIKQIEQMLVSTLGYWFGAPTELTFLTHYLELLGGIVPNSDFLQKLTLYMAKVNLFDYALCSVKPSMAAAATIYASLTLLGMNGNSLYIQTLSKHSRCSVEEISALSTYILEGLTSFNVNYPTLKKLSVNSETEIVQFLEQLQVQSM